MDISLINPYIRVAMHSRLRKGAVISRRVIYDYELIYIAEGEFVLRYAEIDYKCTAGKFILLRPGISHSFTEINEELSQPHIHFDLVYTADSDRIPVSFKDIDEFTEEERRQIREDVFAQYPPKPFVAFSDNKKALELFFAILTQPTPSVLTQKSLLIQLIDLLIADNYPSVFRESAVLSLGVETQVKNYIDAGQGMSYELDDFARQFNYSKYHLERRFKLRYGVPLMTYRNERRLQLAKNMLGKENVSTVSEKMGFSSIYVFSRAFKNHFGISPRDLLKENELNP